MSGRVGLDHTRVVDAAADLVDAVGIDGLTLAALAKQLHVRSQSLYAHVDGLDGLRRDLALVGQARLGDQLRDAAVGRSGRDALVAIAYAYRSFALDHPGLYAASLRSPADDPQIAAAVARTMEPLSVVLRSCGLGDESTLTWYRLLWSSVHGFVALQRSGLMTLPVDTDSSFAELVGALADGVERAASGAGEQLRHPEGEVE